MKCSETGDGRDDHNPRQFGCDDGGRIRSADRRGGLSRQVQSPAGTPWRQGPEETGRAVRGCGIAWPARPDPTTPGCPAGGSIQSGSVVSSARQSGICRAGSECLELQGGGFIPEGNAGVNGGSENPGALHPTKQGRLALWIRKSALQAPVAQDSATVWGLRAETGLGRFRFVHHLGFRLPGGTPKPAEQPDE